MVVQQQPAQSWEDNDDDDDDDDVQWFNVHLHVKADLEASLA